MKNNNFKLFTKHPHSINETYFEHFVCASYYGFRMIFSGLASIVHGLFPFLFETTTSDCAKEINREVERRNGDSKVKDSQGKS
jgi:hypothetical protein|tara:strand:- start:1220 stop:1468 length:249 start_codon:yes stop_codon:yes gene_type:complete